LREGRPPPGPSPAWTLDTLVPGESNELVLSAANAVIASPGAVYNPLVIVGGSGVGKTHVLHGIGNELAGGASARVACLSAQEFVDELLDAIDGDRVEGWRKRYRGATALLLDDVHLLAGKERSQEELFNLYNTLLTDQRQMVFTLVAAPKQIEGLDPRLVSRLDGGLVAELGEPDLEVREGIVARRLRGKHPDADPALIAYLAARRADSVRTVINTVQRFLRAVQAENVEPTLTFAQALLEGAAPTARSSAAIRTSGMIPALGAGVRSREKVVWEWPDPEERVIEELA